MKKYVLILLIFVMTIFSCAFVTAENLTQPDNTFLLELAKDTFTYLSSDWATDNHLPWSWRSVSSSGGDYANTAEMGFYMTSWIGAYELSQPWSPTWSQVETELGFTLDRLEAWQSGTQSYQPNGKNAYNNSVFYQWYWITWSPPVVGGTSGNNQDVSSLDNAWLAASLIFIREYSEAKNKPALAAKAQNILKDMNFTMWYDSANRRFNSGGYQNPRTGFYYDYYSNENRIINYVAYILGQLNESELNLSLASLVQSSASYNGITVKKVNWDGSYFTYASPTLFIKETVLPYADLTLNPATMAQIKYSIEEKGFPVWGHSDCYGIDLGDYLRRGAPPRGSGNSNQDVGDSIITPHASSLALTTLYAYNATENLKKIASLIPASYDSQYGFKDSVDVITNKTSSRFASLDQGWIFLSLMDYFNSTVWNYLYLDNRTVSLHNILLQEYIPSPNCTDSDHDRFNISGQQCGPVDCNDFNASINPNAIEVCDGTDNDCDSIIDEGCNCTFPYDGMNITASTILCKGNYSLPNGVLIKSYSVTLDCNGAVITGNGSSTGVSIGGWVGGCTIKNCVIRNFNTGMYNWDGYGNSFINNTLINSTSVGIYVVDTESTTVKGNIFINNSVGVSVYWYGQNHLIENNFAEDNTYGITIASGPSNSIIRKNIAKKNTYGIYEDRTHVDRPNKDNNYTENTVINNIYGFFMEYSTGNFIERNDFINNSYGFYILGENNTIDSNNFINNNIQATNPLTYHNFWDYNNEGNYWSNYDVPAEGCNDTDNNGICDSAYIINANNTDNFPFTRQNGWISRIFTLQLVKGWNLISVPFILENNSVGKVFGGINYSSIFYYSSGWRNATKINSSLGYWVKSGNNQSLSVEGLPPENPQINLSKGWSLIGCPYLEQKNISSLFDNVTVYMYNNSKWYSYGSKKSINILYRFTPGFGYVIKGG